MDYLRALFSLDSFMPHGSCYQWTESLIALHVIADGLTFLAYMSLSLTMLWLVKKKKDIPFNYVRHGRLFEQTDEFRTAA